LRTAVSISPVADEVAVNTGRLVPNISRSGGWIPWSSATMRGLRWKNIGWAVAA
jgi:hypothetical protein